MISLLLLFSTYRTTVGYSSMRETTIQYIDWHEHAYDMQRGSDYLTEQVRCFAVTGERKYLDYYFLEANVTQRREKALQNMAEYFSGTETYRAMETAMAQSVELMNREYYAMRLTVEAHGYVLSTFPKIIQEVELSEEDAALTPQEKEALAQSMVFDAVYRGQKDTITKNMEVCLEHLATEANARQTNASENLHNQLRWQQALIFLLILVVLGIVALTSLQVVAPLLRATLHIRGGDPIPVSGANEIRFLAKTYNRMLAQNKKVTEHLEYEAAHDKLTGLNNRTRYEELTENMDFAKAAVMIIDIDKFKSINDTFGHDMGDRVLTNVGEILQKSFRSADHIFRIGGDEFVVIMENIGPANKKLIYQKIRGINRILGQEKELLTPVSISAGVAFGNGEKDFETLFKEADEALYRAKKDQDNDCCMQD